MGMRLIDEKIERLGDFAIAALQVFLVKATQKVMGKLGSVQKALQTRVYVASFAQIVESKVFWLPISMHALYRIKS